MQYPSRETNLDLSRRLRDPTSGYEQTFDGSPYLVLAPPSFFYQPIAFLLHANPRNTIRARINSIGISNLILFKS